MCGIRIHNSSRTRINRQGFTATSQVWRWLAHYDYRFLLFFNDVIMTKRLTFGNKEDIKHVKQLQQDEEDLKQIIDSLKDAKYPSSVPICWKCEELLESSQPFRHENTSYSICGECGAPNID